MTKTTALIVAIPFGFGLLVAPAQAQSVRTYVSSFGNDNNNCGRSTPCRTFQAAHDKTLPGGEMLVLDQGNFATLTITKSISIVNEGIGQASILVGNGDTGLTINAPNAKVNLRGLTIEGVGDSRGMLVSSVLSLTMTNCVVRNHTGDGIATGNVPSGTTSTFTISNTFVFDNGGNGVFIQSINSGRLSVVLNRVEIYNSGAHGLGINGNSIHAVVTESVSANNRLSGFVITGPGPGVCSDLTIKRSVSFNNGTFGAQADGPCGTVALSESIIHPSWEMTNGGSVVSYGGNIGSGSIQAVIPTR